MSQQTIPVIGEIVHIPQADQSVQYRLIPNTRGYAAGADGSVWSCLSRRGVNLRLSPPKLSEAWTRLRSGTLNKYGHQNVRIRIAGRRISIGLHRVILLAFVGPCPEGMECRHFPDRNPRNNRLENLSWGTVGDNFADRVVHKTSAQGTRNPRAKLTEDQVVEIRARYAELRKKHPKRVPRGVRQAMTVEYATSSATIDQLVSGKTWQCVGVNY